LVGGVSFGIDFEVTQQAFDTANQVLADIFDKKQLFGVPQVESRLNLINRLEESKNIEGFVREHLRIKHLMHVYQNVSDVFRNYKVIGEVINIGFDSQFRDG